MMRLFRFCFLSPFARFLQYTPLVENTIQLCLEVVRRQLPLVRWSPLGAFRIRARPHTSSLNTFDPRISVCHVRPVLARRGVGMAIVFVVSARGQMAMLARECRASSLLCRVAFVFPPR